MKSLEFIGFSVILMLGGTLAGLALQYANSAVVADFITGLYPASNPSLFMKVIAAFIVILTISAPVLIKKEDLKTGENYSNAMSYIGGIFLVCCVGVGAVYLLWFI